MFLCSKCKREYKTFSAKKIHENKCCLDKQKISTIRTLYQEGENINQIARQFNSGKSDIYFLIKDILRTKSEAIRLAHKLKPQKLSEITKDKIRKARIKYLNEHPEKVPYKLNHSSKESWIEKYFKETLQKNNIIGWVQSYCFGIYEYDFAFPLHKIDVEIDGPTHELENVIKIDKRRDEWSKSQGWRVLRFKAKHVRNDIGSCMKILQDALDKGIIDQILIDDNFKDLQFNRHLEKQKKERERCLLKEQKKHEKQEKLKLQKQIIAEHIKEHKVIKKQHEQFCNELEKIDVSKYGWLSKLSRSLNLSHSHAKRRIKQFFPDLICFKRLKKSKEELKITQDKQKELEKIERFIKNENQKKIDNFLFFLNNNKNENKESSRSLERQFDISHKIISKILREGHAEEILARCLIDKWYRYRKKYGI